MTYTTSGMSGSFRFILASTSPRRREFLQILGVPFIVVSPGTPNGEEIDETPLPNETPAALVQRLSKLKAQAVLYNLNALLPPTDKTQTNALNVVVAADTVVVLEDKILGKPDSPAGAVQMLKLLRKQLHYVYSGITVAYLPQTSPGTSPGVFSTRLHQSKVWMRPYTNAEIAAYVAGGSPLDKAGAYGIQDQTFAPVERLEGCFASVMGLPLGELAVALAEIGLSLPEVDSRCTRHTGVLCCQLPPTPKNKVLGK